MARIATFLLAGLLSSLPTAAAQAPAAPVPEDAGASLRGARALDLAGELHVLCTDRELRGTALVLLGEGCPVSNRTLPELGRLAGRAKELGIAFFGVLSDPFLERAAALEYAREYELEFPILFDADGSLAALLAPRVTPEAFLLDPDGALVYRGRVDDRSPELGRMRGEPSKRELLDGLEALGAGRAPAVVRTEAVGCVFEGWQEPGETEVNWARHVAPILQAQCVECHRPGNVAPFALTGYAEAARKAKMIASVTGSGRMPPWKAEHGFGAFENERRLTPRQVELIRRWAESGAPEGDPAEAPPQREFPSGWALGEPDLELEMREDMVVPAEGSDLFVCFVIPTGLTEDKKVRAFEFRPGNPAVVHHALFYTDDKGAARALDAADERPGYQSFGGVGFRPRDSLGGWVPGNPPYELPPGVARRISQGTDLVIYFHYHPSGKVETDRSRLALWFTDEEVAERPMMAAVWVKDFMIPAGAADFALHEERVLERDYRVLGAVPHMHYVGKSMKVVAELPSGESVPIISIPEWDFTWQQWYRYFQPLELPKGTKLVLDARFDNSASNPWNPSSPPRDVRQGEQTWNEMCKCFLEILVPWTPAPAPADPVEDGATDD